MAAPLFRLQIIDGSGQVVQVGGRRLELDLLQAIRAQGVGFLRTEAQVLRAIQTAIQTLKDETRQIA